MDSDLLAMLRRGRRDADRWAQEQAGSGGFVVRTIGRDLPLPLLRACGVAPVAVVPAHEVSIVLPPTSLNAEHTCWRCTKRLPIVIHGWRRSCCCSDFMLTWRKQRSRLAATRISRSD